jgi:hypothetical protein
MKIKIYVQSCGVAQEHGYCWVDENQKIVEEHPLVKKAKDLIESEAFSVVLARNSDKLLLLVTGLKASERKDYRGRTIRNSVAWVGQDTDENECTLRALTAFALRDSLREDIDGAVNSYAEKGFEASFEKIQKLTAKAKAETQDLPSLKKEIKQASKENKEKLADELEKYRLPQHETFPLVVVTGNQDKKTLEDAKVWRGMSNLVTKAQEKNQQPQLNQLAPNIFQWLFDRVNISIPMIGIPGTAIALIAISYFTFQVVPNSSPVAIQTCSAITPGTLVFYAKQGEVDVADESVIKVSYAPQEIENISLVDVDKDGKYLDIAEEKTNNPSKRELTYRPRFDSPGMHQLQLQGTNIATRQPICEQSIYIHVRPE